MVRGRSYLHLVKKMLADGLYLDISRDEIGRCVYTDGEFDEEFEVDVDDNGTEVTLVVRMVVHRGQKETPETYAIALLVHDIRVTGIDFETRFKDTSGVRGRGWHRHEWDAAGQTAEYRKIRLDGFESLTDLDGFLIRAMQELKITLSGKDYGAPGLQFN